MVEKETIIVILAGWIFADAVLRIKKAISDKSKNPVVWIYNSVNFIIPVAALIYVLVVD